MFCRRPECCEHCALLWRREGTETVDQYDQTLLPRRHDTFLLHDGRVQHACADALPLQRFVSLLGHLTGTANVGCVKNIATCSYLAWIHNLVNAASPEARSLDNSGRNSVPKEVLFLQLKAHQSLIRNTSGRGCSSWRMTLADEIESEKISEMRFTTCALSNDLLLETK